MDFTMMKRFGCWVVAGGMFALGQCCLYAQQSNISWSSMNAGFAVHSSNSITMKSAVGQMAVGATGNASLRIQSGFLADTTLRGLILAVKDEIGLPYSYSLDQNFPNPFNPATTIRYELPKAAHITITVFDILGKSIITLKDEFQEPGEHTVMWDARNAPSGVYFCRFHAGKFIQVRKMILMK